MKNTRPIPLQNSSLQYAPENELGVVFLFATLAKKLRFKVEKIQQNFPDCIAYQRIGDSEKKVRIEFEYKSSSFVSHKHNPKKCDYIVCWHHDWHQMPKNLKVIELKKSFNLGRKIWIQPARNVEHRKFLESDLIEWPLSKKASTGDLLLMYRCSPEKKIAEIFEFTGKLEYKKANWRGGYCYEGTCTRICKLDSPIFLDDMRNHQILKTSSFIRGNMQGNHNATEYWSHLYDMILKRNPRIKNKNILSRFAPENIQ